VWPQITFFSSNKVKLYKPATTIIEVMKGLHQNGLSRGGGVSKDVGSTLPYKRASGMRGSTYNTYFLIDFHESASNDAHFIPV